MSHKTYELLALIKSDHMAATRGGSRQIFSHVEVTRTAAERLYEKIKNSFVELDTDADGNVVRNPLPIIFALVCVENGRRFSLWLKDTTL